MKWRLGNGACAGEDRGFANTEDGKFFYSLKANNFGISVLCNKVEALFALKESQVILEFNNYCNWLGIGNVISNTKIKVKEIPNLRRKLGIVFQDFQLLTDRNVFDNLEFVLKATGWKNKAEIKARIDEVLDSVHLSGVKDKMPYELSGGEQQRAAIARALLNHPELILADEPTGNLDPEKSEKIIELLKEINAKGTTILIATHDYSIIKKYSARTIKCATPLF